MEILNIYKKIIDETFFFLKEKNYISYSKNAEILLRIIAETYKNTNSVSDSKLLRSFESMVNDLMEKMYKEGYFKEVNELSITYIETLKESLKGKKESIYYPIVFDKVFESIANKSNVEDIKEIKSILSRIKYSSEISYSSELFKYNNFYYFNLIRNRHIGQDELQRLKQSFTKELIFNLNYKSEDTLLSVELKTLYQLLKKFSFEGNKLDLNSILNQTFTSEKLSNNGIFNKLIVVLFMYVYYIVIRENDVELEKKDGLKNIFKHEIFIDGNQIKTLIKRLDLNDFWDSYSELYKEFSTGGWELLKENEVKQLTIHRYVNEFFLFLSIYLYCEIGKFYDENIFEDLNWDRMNELITYFDKSEKLKPEHINNFKHFVLLLEEDHKELDSELNQLVEENQIGTVMLNVFKKRFLEKKAQKKIEAGNEYTSAIQKEKEEMYQRFDNMVFKDINKNIERDEIHKNIKIDKKFYLTPLSIDYFDENVIKFGPNLSDIVIGGIEDTIIQCIKEHVEIIEFNIKDKGKISQIMNSIQEGFEINSRITSDRISRAITFMESDADIKLFNNKTRLLIPYGKFINLPFDFYFNDKLLNFNDLSITLEIKNFTKEDINQVVKEKEKAEGDLIIDIQYGNVLHLSEEQFHEYYKNSYYKVEVFVKGEIILKAPKIGFILAMEKN